MTYVAIFLPFVQSLFIHTGIHKWYTLSVIAEQQMTTNLSSLEQCTFSISLFLWVRSPGRTYLAPLPGSHKAAVKGHMGLGCHLEVRLGKDPLLSSLGMLSEVTCLCL